MNQDLQHEPDARRGTATWRGLAILAAMWLAAATTLAAVLSAQEGLPFRYAFASSAIDLATLAALLGGVWWLMVRFEAASLAVKVLLHLALAAVVVPTWETLKRLYLERMVSPEVATIYVEEAGYWAWLQSMSIYAMATSALVALLAFRRLHEEERRANRLQLLMREAELRALRAQLRPHFLFNTLNGVYSLIPDRPSEAASMVAQLSDLLRETLEHSDQSAVPLEAELRLAQRYLEIEAVRMGERLRIEMAPHPETLDALVPPLILQPLAENAIRHGAAPSTDAVCVRVEAERNGDRLVLRVVDDGCGLGAKPARTDRRSASAHESSGHGLRITRSRLDTLYGEAAQFELTPNAPRGCVATISLPFAPATAAAATAETHAPSPAPLTLEEAS